MLYGKYIIFIDETDPVLRRERKRGGRNYECKRIYATSLLALFLKQKRRKMLNSSVVKSSVGVSVNVKFL